MLGENTFMGAFKHSVDPKNRVFIPASLREEMGDEVYVIKGVDPCIAVYTQEGWEAFVEKLSSLPEIQARKVKRALLSSACKTKIDSQGRILITQIHKTYAGLDKNVYVVGVGNHVEIWDEDRWNSEDAMGAEEMAETLISLGF